jgi:hypothetical protein
MIRTIVHHNREPANEQAALVYWLQVCTFHARRQEKDEKKVKKAQRKRVRGRSRRPHQNGHLHNSGCRKLLRERGLKGLLSRIRG